MPRFRSIRWWLPTTYALIAFLAVLALGVVLLSTLRGYYAQREYEQLWNNAQAISQEVGSLYVNSLTQTDRDSLVQALAYVVQARVRLLDSQERVIADSGAFSNQQGLSMTFNQGVPMMMPMMMNGDASPMHMMPGGMASAGGVSSAGGIGNWVFGVITTPYGVEVTNAQSEVSPRSEQTATFPIIASQNYPIGYLELSESPAIGHEIITITAQALLWAGVAAVLIAALVGWWISRRVSLPLLDITRTTGRMASGDLSARVAMQRADELGTLAGAFNHMAAQVEQTVTTLRRFVADAAHELHTPITALRSNLELATSATSGADEQSNFLKQAQAQVTRLERLTRDLLDLSRLEAGEHADEFKPINLTALTQELGEVYASRAEQAGVDFTLQLPATPTLVNGQELRLRRVFSNVLDNALKFTPEGGCIMLQLATTPTGVRLSVQDTGIGIPPDDLPRLFSRFSRGRNAAAYPGSGLGLAISKAIIERHGGDIQIESATGQTHVHISLPAAEGNSP